MTKVNTPRGRAKYMIDQAYHRAKRNGGICDIDIDWLENIIINGKCMKTGIKFKLETGSPYVPSLDRIDSSNPNYTVDNVDVVLWGYNNALNNWDDEEFILEIAQGIKNKRMHG